MGLPLEEHVRHELPTCWDTLNPGTHWVWEALESAYTGPGRHYHNLIHIHECLVHAEDVMLLLDDRRAVENAIFFHDAVYDPTRSDNEEQSAALAERYLWEMDRPAAFIARVRELILDTRHKVEPVTNDGRYLVDIDLAILGAPPERFDEYERAIRQEYAHVPDDAFRAGRANILRTFLSRPSIYLTEHFRAKYEGPARANLERSIARVEGP
jgi:predicted metal-dependent HD superfamily phosphohydrolase